MAGAYSRSNPRYRRLYAALDLSRAGYRKYGERWPSANQKLLVYRRSMQRLKIKTIYEAVVFPDGTVVKTSWQVEIDTMGLLKNNEEAPGTEDRPWNVCRGDVINLGSNWYEAVIGGRAWADDQLVIHGTARFRKLPKLYGGDGA